MNTIIYTKSHVNAARDKDEPQPLSPDSDCLYFAYKLGYLSRSNIRHEARKPEPQLFRLIAHASLFDSTKKYIQEHVDVDVDVEDEVEAEVTEVEQTLTDEKLDEEDFEVSYVEDIDQESSIIDLISSSTQNSQQDLLLQQKDICGGSKTPHTWTIPQTDPRIPWEEDSDLSTESGDEMIDDDYWSDSTLGDESLSLENLDIEPFDCSSSQLAGLCSQEFKTATDDSVIWSQQPRVWSTGQIEDLLAQTFG